MSKIVCDFPADFKPGSNTVVLFDENGMPRNLPYTRGDVRLKKTKEDKKRSKKAYRKIYMARPEVKERNEKKRKDPDYIKKKQEYAARPDVKKRKQESSMVNRAIRRILKDQNESLYQELAKKARELMLVN